MYQNVQKDVLKQVRDQQFWGFVWKNNNNNNNKRNKKSIL